MSGEDVRLFGTHLPFLVLMQPPGFLWWIHGTSSQK